MRNRPEALIHKAVVGHLTARAYPGVLWWHTPNGAYYGGLAHRGAIMKSLGVRAGVPDILAIHRREVFCLELKTRKGRLSPAQTKFLESARAAGARTYVANGVDEAIDVLEYWGLLRSSYDGERDFAGSIEEGFSSIRERVASGGPPWTPKEPEF